MSENNGGRGKKQCPKCKTFLGVRTQACECGHQFAFKTEAPAGPVASTKKRTNPVQAQVQTFYQASEIANVLALANDVRELSVSLGGPEATGVVLDRIEALSGKTGGIAGLRSILATVVPVPQPEPNIVLEPVPVEPVPTVVQEAPVPAEKPARKGKKAVAPHPKPAEAPAVSEPKSAEDVPAEPKPEDVPAVAVA